MTADPVLTPSQRGLLASARRAVLATIAPDGRPRLVPICFVLDDVRPVLYSPLDEKPKRVLDPRELARVQDLLRDPRVSVLIDRWDEDWTRLAWLRCDGMASLLEPADDDDRAHRAAVAALRSSTGSTRRTTWLGRPLIRVVLDRATSWGLLEADDA